MVFPITQSEREERVDEIFQFKLRSFQSTVMLIFQQIFVLLQLIYLYDIDN